MSQLLATTNRLACNSSARDGMLDLVSGDVVQAFRGSACLLQCALFNGEPSASTFVSDTSNILSIDVYVRLNGPTGTLIALKTLNGSDVNDVTYANWAAGTAQHFTVPLSGTDTNQLVPSDNSLPIYYVIRATTSLRTFVAGFGIGQIIETGDQAIGDPEIPAHYVPILVDDSGLVQNPILDFTDCVLSGLDFGLGGLVLDQLQVDGDVTVADDLHVKNIIATNALYINQIHPNTDISQALAIEAGQLDITSFDLTLGDADYEANNDPPSGDVWFNANHIYFGAPFGRTVSGLAVPFPAPPVNVLGYFARNGGGIADVAMDIWVNATSANTFHLRKFRGTPNSPLPINTGDVLGNITFDASFSGGIAAAGVKLQVVATENWSSLARGSTLKIQTIKTGEASLGDRLIFDGGGHATFSGNLAVTGDFAGAKLTIGGGAQLVKILKTTAVWDIGSVAAADNATNNVTLTGVLTTDVLVVTPNDVNGNIGAAYFAANTVQLTYRNTTASAQDNTPVTFTIIALRFT